MHKGWQPVGIIDDNTVIDPALDVLFNAAGTVSRSGSILCRFKIMSLGWSSAAD